MRRDPVAIASRSNFALPLPLLKAQAARMALPDGDGRVDTEPRPLERLERGNDNGELAEELRSESMMRRQQSAELRRSLALVRSEVAALHQQITSTWHEVAALQRNLHRLLEK